MLYGWEGNRRSGITPAMHHRCRGLNGLGKGDEHPLMLLEGHGTVFHRTKCNSSSADGDIFTKISGFTGEEFASLGKLTKFR